MALTEETATGKPEGEGYGSREAAANYEKVTGNPGAKSAAARQPGEGEMGPDGDEIQGAHRLRGEEGAGEKGSWGHQ